jgi:precorrin-2 dehydrogenase/sirohydrochlorin ferrochelatase
VPGAYPVSLIVSGRRCLVVGGGRIAARKAAGLLECGAVVHVVAEDVGAELRALADPWPAALTWEERPYRATDVEGGYWVVISATASPEVNAAVAADAEEAQVWVNAADDPASCSFFVPSVARRGPISVAVSTGGTSPALAAWLRRRIEAGLGPEYAELARLLGDARNALQASGRSTEGANWQAALDSDMLDLIRAGHVGLAKERLQECL